MKEVKKDEQPFSEEHGWQETRYGGVFAYLISLITDWKWLHLVMGHFGNAYKIFMLFVLMAARNIRSIEQLKNVRFREAGVLLGIKKLPSLPKIWEWFYVAANKGISGLLKLDYFRYQIHAGLVAIWLWFTDGHLLPYTGKERVHHSYNTQRRMPVPGRTNLVTCDASGRIVDFKIQEGKGDLRGRIKALAKKWKGEVSSHPVMVFNREGDGAGFFSGLVLEEIPFVTWEKNTDAEKLAAIEDNKFEKEITFNGKSYSFFEGEKSFTYIPDEPNTKKPNKNKKHTFILRRVYPSQITSAT